MSPGICSRLIDAAISREGFRLSGCQSRGCLSALATTHIHSAFLVCSFLSHASNGRSRRFSTTRGTELAVFSLGLVSSTTALASWLQKVTASTRDVSCARRVISGCSKKWTSAERFAWREQVLMVLRKKSSWQHCKQRLLLEGCRVCTAEVC
ncbi:hypothetical protein HDK90DRAFT_74477 [Phyllosticta capitalensis]|uniref:Uncharacterized protein n=1 Tax=Phyllosticta capitalensis TaxID=121624 RepID=A0ABR1YDH8_9PEZI